MAGRVVAQRQQAGRPAQPEDGRGSPFAQAPQILPEPCLDRTEGPAVQALDEAPNAPERILECEPGIALAPLGRRRRADVPTADPERGGAPGLGGQPAGGQDRVEQRETERSQDRRGPQVTLDALEDRPKADQLTRCVQRQELVGKLGGAGNIREARAQPGAHRRGSMVGHRARQIVGVEC